MITEKIMTRVANAICVGATKEDVHDMLQGEGLSEYDIFLAYCAGMIIAESTETSDE